MTQRLRAASTCLPGYPIGGQLGDRLARSAPLLTENLSISKPDSGQHVIHGARQFMGEDRQGFAFAMFPLHARELFLACRIVPEEQDGGFGEGPLEVCLADLLAGGAVAFAGRSLVNLTSRVGEEFLHAGEVADLMAFLEQHQGQDFADPRNRAQTEKFCAHAPWRTGRDRAPGSVSSRA